MSRFCTCGTVPSVTGCLVRGRLVPVPLPPWEPAFVPARRFDFRRRLLVLT